MKAVMRNKDAVGVIFLALIAVGVYSYFGSYMVEHRGEAPLHGEFSQK